MKTTIRLAFVTVFTLGATTAFATNGSNLIATGAKARAMGGTSIGMSHGAESGLSNPALITKIKGVHEISFGGTIFMPDVKNNQALYLGAQGDHSGSAQSKADMNIIPEVSVVSKISENLYLGMGMWGTAGMGVDYDGGNSAQLNMSTNLQLMQFGVPIAYTTSGFSLAVTPVIQYGSLDINYDLSKELQIAMGNMAATQTKNIGSGVQQDLAFGFTLGIAYEIENLTIGAIHKSQIDMLYTGVLSGAIQGFGITNYNNDILSTPEENGIGVSYKINNHTIALDYKRINWSDAEGYKDFEWQDQDVYTLGYEYATDTWALRAGYNYSKCPIEEQKYSGTNSAGLNAGTVNTFNLLGFPAIIESHYTFGGTYALNEQVSVDTAIVYTPEATETFTNFMNQDISVKHSQTSITLGLNYNY